MLQHPSMPQLPFLKNEKCDISFLSIKFEIYTLEMVTKELLFLGSSGRGPTSVSVQILYNIIYNTYNHILQ